MIPKWTELEVLKKFVKNRNFPVAGVSEKYLIMTLFKVDFYYQYFWNFKKLF